MSSLTRRVVKTVTVCAAMQSGAEAEAVGGNAVVGVDLDYETIGIGQGGKMLIVSASGTGVVTS
jgi:uncharacterized protein YbjQ (UPF0145 family)